MKKSLLFSMALLAGLSAWAQTVNSVITSEEQTRTSTVYVGEVVVDGQPAIKYLYSGDMTVSYSTQTNLLNCLRGMADGDFADLLEGQEFDYTTEIEGFATCADATLAAAMDENWSNAQNVATQYYADKSVVSAINSNLYDLDDGFKAAVDADNAERMAVIDNPIDVEKSIVFHVVGGSSSNSVWYEVVEGQVVKHVDTNIVYACEVTTVIYTKVELETATVTGIKDINAATAKSGQRYNLMGQPVGNDYKGFVIEDGRKIIVR